jgi:hypothetical protein
MLSLMMMAALSARAETPDFDRLSAGEWSEVGTRRSDVGEIHLRARYVEAIGCVEGTATVEVDPEALLSVADHMAKAPEWSSAPLTISEELERDGEGFVLFQVLDVPGWTLANDRFWTIRAEPAALAEGVTRYRWHRVDSTTWPRVAEIVGARAVEPPVNYGEWLFTPAGTGSAVQYRACADFGGRVPAPIQRWINTQQVPALIEELVAEAARQTE